MARQVFYSFHYIPDNWRASQVRNIGVIEGNRPSTDNDWEQVTRAGDTAIRAWIDSQLNYRSCTIVLVGAATAGRKWINYEIEKSWKDRKGVVGINVHNLKDSGGKQSFQGNNPFNNIVVNNLSLHQVLKLYNPPYSDSKLVYDYISNNISAWVEEAVAIRNKY